MTVNQVLCDMHHQLPSTAHKLYECTQGLFSSSDYGKYFFFNSPGGLRLQLWRLEIFEVQISTCIVETVAIVSHWPVFNCVVFSE